MTIATRYLSTTTNGRTHEVPVTLEAPQAGPDGGWHCDYAIGWPDGVRLGQSWGIDAFQALHLALERIGADLHANTHHKAGSLSWLKPRDGYGFPVPPNMQNLLVGSDRHLSGRSA